MRLRLINSIGLYQKSIVDPQLRTAASHTETHVVASSDNITFSEDEVGVTIHNVNDSISQEVFVPWSNVRSFERDAKPKTNKKK